MPAVNRQYEVVSVSFLRDLVRRANAVIPRARRSEVITSMLTSFLDSIEHTRLEREYASNYAQPTKRDEDEEREVLNEWRLSDAEAWSILEKEEAYGRGKAR